MDGNLRQPKHTPVQTVLLHLVPGILIAGIGGLLAYLFRTRNIPAYFFLEVTILLVMIPVMIGIMMDAARRQGAGGGVKIQSLLMRPGRPVAAWKYIVYPVIITAFAGGVFTLLGPWINEPLKELLVPELPPWLDLTHLFTHPEAYGRGWLIVSWVLSIPLIVFAGPVIEEIYFRGYLLPRIPGPPAVMVILGIVLFAVYHVFSFWMIPVRIIALFPLVLLVWRTRDIRIGIIGHCLLNLVGDTVSSIPIVFS
jgi:hypothetical protein